jgi:EmrB/QacA subfamily drug resistance transporter
MTINAPTARRRGLALAFLAVAQFMVFLDESVVNVALPSIKASLGFSQASLAWVVSAYMLSFGGLLLLGGRAADLFGRRRIFLAGTAVFGAASLLDGLAQSQGMLIAARGLQGAGAALATPAALSLVTALFPAGPERAKALGIWGGLSGLGFAAGILLGGVITDLASWRWVFLINLPVAVTTLAVVPRLIASRRASRNNAFDIAGGATITLAMATLVYALLNAPTRGWTSLATHALIAAALVILTVFVAVERRSGAPLVPPGFLRDRTVIVPNAVQLLLGASLPSSFLLLALYTQQVLGYTALEAGFAYIPLAAGVAAATVLANRIMARTGPRVLAAVGLAIAAMGLARLGHAPVTGRYLTDLLPALLLLGAGAGLAFVSITTAALGGADEADSGLASGLLSTSVMLGGAIGVAVLIGVVSARSGDVVGAGSSRVAAEVAGLNLAFLVAAAIALVASVTAAVGFRRAAMRQFAL